MVQKICLTVATIFLLLQLSSLAKNINSEISLDAKLLQSNVSTEYGLVFEKEFQYRWENNSYTDVIQLIGLNNTAQALQFRILVNKTEDDSIILIFEDLEKGNNISDSSWILDYNIFRGPITPGGASADEIYVLLYNINQNHGLPPGDYNELFKVNYRVIDLPDIRDSIKSSIKISGTLASTYQGYPIDITPTRNEFKIYVRVPVVYPDHGIIFEKDTVYQLEKDSYTEIMQLKDLSDKAQALQFKLLVNKSQDDSTIITFENIQKGADITDPSWTLDYNVIKGPPTSNGVSQDEVYVILYNQNQNNGLPPGDYNELFKVKYRIDDIPNIYDSLKSSIKISGALASTYQGYPIDITPSQDRLTIFAKTRIGLYGDVNDDGCVDLLDLIMMVDHIIGRDSLDIEEFVRADIAPWIIGNPSPSPDGYVNVMDLVVLQDIILTGVYPDGTSIPDCNNTALSKLNGYSESKLILYINTDGITTFLDSKVDIRGLQIEFGSISNDPNGTVINIDLGQGYYKKIDESLKVLLYDWQGKKIFAAGENVLAVMPFHITNPEKITIEKIVLIDINRKKLADINIEIIYGTPPSLPLDYVLYQNYPNPFNLTTTIKYSIPNVSNVILKVFDIIGTEITTLVNEEKPIGIYEVNWNAASATGGLPSGVYFYQLKAGDFVQTKKMILLK